MVVMMWVYLFLQVSTGTVPVSLVFLTVSLPSSTRAGNPLLYITSIKTSPVRIHNQQTSHFYTQSIINMSEHTSLHVEMIWHDISHNRLKKSIVQAVNWSTRLRSLKNLIQPDSQRRVSEEQMNWSVHVDFHLKKSWNPRMWKTFAFVIDRDTQRKY